MVKQSAEERSILVAAILSLNDGLNSNLNLILFAVGTSMGNIYIILTGLAGVISGAISMANSQWQALEATGSKPFKPAVSAFLSFTGGSIIPLLPFFFLSGVPAVVVSVVLSANALFTMGVVDTKKQRIRSGIRQAVCGILSALVTYVLGNLANWIILFFTT